jgi:hypothetical protein
MIIVKMNNNFMNYLRCSNNLKTIYFLKYLLYIYMMIMLYMEWIIYQEQIDYMLTWIKKNSLILVGKVKCIYLLLNSMTMLNSLSFVICVLVAMIVRGNKFYVAWYFPLLLC